MLRILDLTLSNGKSLRAIKQGSESIQFLFLEDHSDFSLQDVLEKGARENYESR